MQNTQHGLKTGDSGDLSSGTMLNCYRLEEPLGKGGMGQVWVATDTHGQRKVAIKVLPREFRDNFAAITQVKDAFQVVHALTHENICKTLGMFEDPACGPYIVMDFIEGCTLSQFQRSGGFPQRKMPLETVVQILEPVARALDYAHRKFVRLADGTETNGILHRDVKPDNILVVLRNGEPHEIYLIDFGLASEIRNSMTRHTNVAVDTRGTRPYMSPEQLKGKRHSWDGRIDQYALAVVTYQLLSGRLPFDGDDDFSLMFAITQEAPEAIEGLPDNINAALLKGLSKNKEDRFATCQEFIAALRSHSVSPEAAPSDSRVPFKCPCCNATGTVKSQLVGRQIACPKCKATVSVSKDGTTSTTNSTSSQLSELETPSQSFEDVESLSKSHGRAELLSQIAGLIKSPGGQAGGGDYVGSQAGDLKELNGIRFRWCPSGSFTMGSPKTELDRAKDEDQVKVTISTGFWLGETELTQGQWQKLMGTTPWSGQEFVKEGSDYPATYISHVDAVWYCQKLTKQERSANRLPKGWKYSLPTEAQWEYACRAGTKTKYSFGDDESQLSEYAWFDETALHVGEEYAHQVGKKKPNPWGLQDMHGNVWEWCRNWYGSELPGGRDPVGAGSGLDRVNRGGSWRNGAAYCRAAYRDVNSPDYRDDFVGFRLALVRE